MTTSACDGAEEAKAYVEGPRTLSVDLNALTYGKIDWERAHGSLLWLTEKVKEVCEEEGKTKMEDYENGRSQFLAKTCVMHVIHTFHACRYDAPHGEPGELEQIDKPDAPDASDEPPPPPALRRMDSVCETAAEEKEDMYSVD